MKKRISALVLALVLVLALCACGSKKDSLEGTTIRVAASPVPHAEILKVAKDILAEQGAQKCKLLFLLPDMRLFCHQIHLFQAMQHPFLPPGFLRGKEGILAFYLQTLPVGSDKLRQGLAPIFIP